MNWDYQLTGFYLIVAHFRILEVFSIVKEKMEITEERYLEYLNMRYLPF